MNEQQLIELITKEVLKELGAKNTSNPFDQPIPIGVSVRHIHLCQADLDVLYGPGYKLNILRDLYQTGEFAAREVVTLIGPGMVPIERVRILGPLRNHTQVEVSRTDAVVLGINPPVRQSGDIKGSASVTLVGPAGVLILKEGVICANRHIHMGTDDARRFGLKDNDIVKVRVTGDKALTFEGVQVRVKETFKLEMHLDTDDANAAGINYGGKAYIVK
jgi:putative phosphotransacetylase